MVVLVFIILFFFIVVVFVVLGFVMIFWNILVCLVILRSLFRLKNFCMFFIYFILNFVLIDFFVGVVMELILVVYYFMEVRFVFLLSLVMIL